MTCSLCSFSLPSNSIVEGSDKFCCSGCHTVYKILSSQKASGSFVDSPLFKRALEAGLISNPALLEEIEAKKSYSNETKRLYFEVGDLWCPSCAEVIKLVLLKNNGIKNCSVDYATDYAIVEYYPQMLSREKIFSNISSLGYTPKVIDTENQGKISFQLTLRLSVAVFAALNLMMFSYPLYVSYFGMRDEEYRFFFAWASLLVAIPCVIYSAYPIFKRFWIALKTRVFGMETLVSMGILSAFFLSLYELQQGSDKVYFDSMSMIIVFVLWGKVIESKAKFSAKSALFNLSRSLPKRARKRFSLDDSRFVPIKEVATKDILLAFTGEKIVMDGTIVEGGGSIDESLMTGESLPKYKGIGADVLGGSLLKSGWIAFQVTRPMEDSFFQKIIETLQHDFVSKDKNDTLIDKVVRAFVPAVLIIAFLTILITGDWVRGMAVLLISCPCAIGIAIPLVEAHLMNRLVSSGIIVRNRSILPMLNKETVMVFDKTGTLTEGKFQVLSGLESLSLRELSILKTMTSFSSHPLSSAISEAIEAPKCLMETIEEIIGQGLRGTFEGQAYLLGSSALIPEGIAPKTSSIHSTLFFLSPEGCCTLQLGDKIRAEAKAFPNAILLSGDSKQAVENVAHACGIQEWHAEKNPLEKREVIEKLRAQNKVIVMVGDGINDAPALSAAHIGISLVSGTDLSIQVSDVLLGGGSLLAIKELFTYGKKAQQLCRQNLFWAFFYNIIGIFLAVFGIFPPIIAALAMMASSLIVILNARRAGH